MMPKCIHVNQATFIRLRSNVKRASQTKIDIERALLEPNTKQTIALKSANLTQRQ